MAVFIISHNFVVQSLDQGLATPCVSTEATWGYLAGGWDDLWDPRWPHTYVRWLDRDGCKARLSWSCQLEWFPDTFLARQFERFLVTVPSDKKESTWHFMTHVYSSLNIASLFFCLVLFCFCFFVKAAISCGTQTPFLGEGSVKEFVTIQKNHHTLKPMTCF